MGGFSYEFDSLKDASNQAKHGVSLALVADFEWETAQLREDVRVAYAERRFQALGYVQGACMLWCFVFVARLCA